MQAEKNGSDEISSWNQIRSVLLKMGRILSDILPLFQVFLLIAYCFYSNQSDYSDGDMRLRYFMWEGSNPFK